MSKVAEQELIIRTLRGVQFDRDLHGGLYDRGRADSYYGRPRNPHWWTEGTGKGEQMTQLNDAERAEYNAGYDDNEASGDRKDWG